MGKRHKQGEVDWLDGEGDAKDGEDDSILEVEFTPGGDLGNGYIATDTISPPLN
jgi:hypothetical protein